MRQHFFEEQHQSFWYMFEETLTLLEKQKKQDWNGQLANFPKHYRMICRHLALAKNRQYSLALVEYLQDLVARSYRILYVNTKQPFRQRFGQFILYDLPCYIRSEYKLLFFSHLLFYIPLVLSIIITYFDPKIANFIGEGVASNFSGMAKDIDNGVNRPMSMNIVMFGFYVFNNIGIAFRAMASGFFLGIGPFLVIVFNAVMIGISIGYILFHSHSSTVMAFFSFIVAHGAFELTGIIFASSAGFRISLALINPQGYSRLDALRLQGKNAGYLITTAFLFLFIAAIIEAFWSSITAMPPVFKLIVGLVLWLFVYAYLIYAGRHRTKEAE